MSRQARKVGPYGHTKVTSLSLPVGVLDLADQVAEIRREGATAYLPGEGETRSAVITDLVDLAMVEVNRRRKAAGHPPMGAGPPAPIPGQLTIE